MGGRRESRQRGKCSGIMEEQSTRGRKKRERRYEESAHNEEYRRWRTERMPRYLQEKNKEQKLKTMARFRYKIMYI